MGHVAATVGLVGVSGVIVYGVVAYLAGITAAFSVVAVSLASLLFDQVRYVLPYEMLAYSPCRPCSPYSL